MSKTKKNELVNDAQKNVVPFQMPQAPSGFRLIPMYKPIWRARPGTRVACYPIGIQPEQTADGRRFTAIMCRLTAPAEVTCTDHEGSREYDAKDGDIIAIDGSDPCMEKVMALAQTPEVVFKIELWCVPTQAGPKMMLFLEGKATPRTEVDPVVIASMKHAQEAAAGSNGAATT